MNEVEPRPAAPARVVALDFLRGLALTMVLVDHIDDRVSQPAFLTQWTLKGLGLSDAAEAFVFLSGVTFGWVYAERMKRDGFLRCQWRAIVRAVQIYAAMMVTVAIGAGLAWLVRGGPLVFRLPITVTSTAMYWDTLLETATLTDPAWGVAVLATYVCVLPFLPPMLWLARRSIPAALGLSTVVYFASHQVPALDLSDSLFNPFAWQYLMVLGMVGGFRARGGWRPEPPHILLLLDALLIAVALLFLVKAELILPPQHEVVLGIRRWLSSPYASKTNLGELRLLHFMVVMILANWWLTRFPGVVHDRFAQPFISSGRHSLTLFCVGVVLSYLAGLAAAFAPETRWTVIALAAIGVAIQFALAWLLELRKSAGNPLESRL